MDKETKNLYSIVNASGFAYQLAIEQAIQDHQREHGWKVTVSEHPWHSEHDSGFIDCVLDKSYGRLVVECKRTRDAKWIFLVPDSPYDKTYLFKCQWAEGGVGKRILAGWDDFKFMPECEESEFCVVRGSGEGETSLLERLASKLITSVDALSSEEIILSQHKRPIKHICILTIITNAELYVARFNPQEIPLDTGSIESAEFEEVECIQFRKTLLTKVDNRAIGADVDVINQLRSRSVLVLNSKFLVDVLKVIACHPASGSTFPWESRQR